MTWQVHPATLTRGFSAYTPFPREIMKLTLFSTLASAAFFALACTGGTTTTEAPVAPPAPPVTTVTTTTTTTGSVGVAECDQYITDMTACLGTMDAATKAAMESSFKQTADAWRAAASTPEGKAGLQRGCKAALDAIPANCKAGAATVAPGTTTVVTGPNSTTVTTPAGTTTVVTTDAKAAEPVKPEGKAEADGGTNPNKQGKSIKRH